MIYNIPYLSGLGDVLMSYVRVGGPSSYAIPLKRAYPETRFRAVVCSHCPEAACLFHFNPHFAEVENVPWSGKPDAAVLAENAAGHPYLTETAGREFGITPEAMPFYLSPAEGEVAAAVASRPFVLFHPWASNAERNWHARIKEGGADMVVTAIVDAGFGAVVVGGSYIKGCREEREEVYFARADDRVINLTGRSARMAAALTGQAAAVVGALSAWVSLAGELDRPTWMKVGRTFEHEFQRPGDVFARFYTQKSVVRWWPPDGLQEDLASLRDFLASLKA